MPFDVSEETLRSAAASIAGEYDGIEVHAVVGDFEHHLDHIPTGGRRVVAFLGSTIGNLAPEARAEFLADVARRLAPGDALLLGTDLVKDADRLVAAYDDAAGVTAEFNRNVLRVLNRELDANFDPDAFTHVALWDPDRGVDRDAPPRRAARRWSASTVSTWTSAFADGEEVRTEISTKFRRGGVESGADGRRPPAHRLVDRPCGRLRPLALDPGGLIRR